MKRTLTAAIALAGWISTVMVPAHAALSLTQRADIRPVKFTTARIIFNGEIIPNKALELIEALDRLHYTSPELKKITLYINSYGGDMDSGYLLYQAIKKSAVPITTVNIAMTASSATLMYCAAKERLVMPAAVFLLHPSSVGNLNRPYIRSDELAGLKQLNDNGNLLFKTVYKSCTNLQDSETDQLLASESNRMLLNASQAIEHKMAEGMAEGVVEADISLIITDDKS